MRLFGVILCVQFFALGCAKPESTSLTQAEENSQKSVSNKTDDSTEQASSTANSNTKEPDSTPSSPNQPAADAKSGPQTKSSGKRRETSTEIPATREKAAELAEQKLDASEKASDLGSAYQAAVDAWRAASAYPNDGECVALTDAALARLKQLEAKMDSASSNWDGEKTIIDR